MVLLEDVSDCFPLPGGTATEFGVYELDGKPLGGDDYLWPCCWCSPMGFGWAVHLAVVEATGIAERELLHDRQVNLCLEHGPRALVYIDNIGLIGKDREEVDWVMGRISHELCSRGLLAKPHDKNESRMNLLYARAYCGVPTPWL